MRYHQERSPNATHHPYHRPGRGKTRIATLLADYYEREGIPYELIHGLETNLQQALEKLEDFPGYIIIDESPTNTLPPEFTPWQIIELSGGYGVRAKRFHSETEAWISAISFFVKRMWGFYKP